MKNNSSTIIIILVIVAAFYFLPKLDLFSISDTGAILITTCTELQNMNNDLSASYALANNIDCAETKSWNGGLGFEPIGNDTAGSEFKGSFNGNGNVISGLFINRPSRADTGLFGEVNGQITRVGLTAVDITGGPGSGSLVGGLVGSSASVSNSYATGSVKPGPVVPGGAMTGGLIGWAQDSKISSCYSLVDVSPSGNYRGGLIGETYHAVLISDSFAAGTITGNTRKGGLIGLLYVGQGEVVHNSYASISSSDDMPCAMGYVGTDMDIRHPGCFKIMDNPSYFRNTINEPMASWDPAIWNLNATGYPTLKSTTIIVTPVNETNETCVDEMGTCADGSHFVYKTCINGSLVEVNYFASPCGTFNANLSCAVYNSTRSCTMPDGTSGFETCRAANGVYIWDSDCKASNAGFCNIAEKISWIPFSQDRCQNGIITGLIIISGLVLLLTRK